MGGRILRKKLFLKSLAMIDPKRVWGEVPSPPPFRSILFFNLILITSSLHWKYWRPSFGAEWEASPFIVQISICTKVHFILDLVEYFLSNVPSLFELNIIGCRHGSIHFFLHFFSFLGILHIILKNNVSAFLGNYDRPITQHQTGMTIHREVTLPRISNYSLS